MMDFNVEDLYGDDYRAAVFAEYDHESALLRRMIELAEEAVVSQEVLDIWTYEGVCYQFAKSIISYAKMPYDNMIIGHFHAVRMIARAKYRTIKKSSIQ